MKEINTLSQTKNIPVTSLCQGLSLGRATYYRHQLNKSEQTAPRSKPANTLSDELRQSILDILHSERFVDSTPYQIYYTLLDEGHYYASIRTFYRLLDDAGETQDRRDQRDHRNTVKPELMASAPNEVWSWDITKLLSTQRLVYYFLYVIIDIYSRYVVGWLIADRECQLLARELIQKTTLKHGIQPGHLTLHSDNGPSMTSHTVAQLLEHLGILKTHNRPYTSNDNPFSESQFKTLKYCPQFPKRFESISDAEIFCQDFFTWYNAQHYHSGIVWLTPQTVHYGKAQGTLEQRHQVLMNAFHQNPIRFNHKKPVLQQLEPVYINRPDYKLNENSLHEEEIMA